MSCNGCRVLRRGCSESCILRPCLQWIESPESQGHATVFVAKFFGRAGLMSFISNVPEDQRPALFQSLLFEAAGRTVNPVNGAVGLLGSGNWHLCQAAVETVLRGGALRPLAEFVTKIDDVSDCTDMFKIKKESCTKTISPSPSSSRSVVVQKRRRLYDNPLPGKVNQLSDLDLSLTPGFQNSSKGKMVILSSGVAAEDEKRRLGSPSMNSEESGTTTCLESGGFEELKLLNLFY